jgi:hypothetical protein
MGYKLSEMGVEKVNHLIAWIWSRVKRIWS